MFSCYKISLAFVAFASTCFLLHADIPKIIFDTDMVEDYDDVGAMAVLHALADEGKCEILAMSTCTRDNSSVAAVEIVNAFYGRPDIPVGCSREIGVVGVPDGSTGRKEHQKFVRLADAYPKWVKHRNSSDAPDANKVYRKALASAPDKSVTFVSVGFMTNMRRLIETVGDDFSPLDGRALVAKKVVRWYVMACKHPKGREYNSRHDSESARIAFERWPTPVVFCDFDLGRDIYSGRAVSEKEYRYRNPVKDMFRMCLPSREQVRIGRGWDKSEDGHSSWDEVTVYAAVCGIGPLFEIERGTFRMIGDEGDNEWLSDESSGNCRLLPASGCDGRFGSMQAIGRLLDELIAREPKCRVVGVAEPTGCPDFTVELPRAAADAVTVFAVDFGLASASDKNATAINCALAEAKRVGAARVELAPGTYRCFDEPGIVIDGFRDFTFDGKGAVLVFRRPPEYRAQPQSELVLEKGNCLVRNCERTLVEDFTMDWDWECDPIGAFVRVVNRSIDTTKPEDSSVDLKFVDYDRYPLYPSPVPFQKVIAMDECRTRFRTGPEFSYGQTEGHFGAKNEWVSPNVLRVWPGIPMEGRNQNPMTGFYKPDPAENLSRVRGYEENGFYRIQHCYYGKNAINLSANRHLTICDVTVWSCFGMALVVDGAQESWQVERFRVVPPSRDEFAKAYPGREYRPRPVTSSSDGHHVARSKGCCRYVGCRWTLNNDDSMNFHDRFTIAVRGSDKVLDVVNRRGADYFRVDKGAEIELRHPNFAPTDWRGRVVNVVGNRIYVDRPMPPQEGQCFLIWDRTYGTDRVHIKDCVFEDSGFRNVFSPSDLTIEDCVFVRTRGNPVQFIADYRSDTWCEGMGATNIVVRNCTFADNNTRNPAWAEISSVCVTPIGWDVGEVDPGFVAGGVLIEGCTFLRSRGPVVDFRCGRDILFRNNTIDTCGVDRVLWPESGRIMVSPSVAGFKEEGTRRLNANGKDSGAE